MSRLTKKYDDEYESNESEYKVWQKLGQLEDILEKHNIKSVDDLDDKLTALEIIDRTQIEIFVVLGSVDYEGYSAYQEGVFGRVPITRKEYNLIKKVFHEPEELENV